MGGGLIKLMILGTVAWVSWQFVRGLQQNGAGGENQTVEQESAQTPMRRCAYCGVHVPEKEAAVWQSQHFCCPAHLEKFKEQ